MTKLKDNDTFNQSTIDLLVGGTPCQSFSVAGLRGGLADPRGNLMLTYLGLADAKKPRWIVWENVPGVLSSNGGRDFGTFLGALGQLGYGFAYRVLDAQYFGVAQRRRRVFVIGYLGDWRPAAAVLFERESLQGHSKPSRKKGQETATDAEEGVGATGDVSCAGGNISPCVTSKWMTGYGGPVGCNETGNMVYQQATHAFKVRGGCEGGGKGYLGQDEQAFTISATQDQQVAQPIAIAENTIGRQPMNGGNGDGFTEDGPMYTLNATGVHGVAQPIILDDQGGSVMRVIQDGICGTLRRETHGHEPLVAQPITMEKIAGPIDASYYKGQGSRQGGEREFVAQPIAYSFDALASNSMKSSNPHSGCRQVETSKTIDTTIPEPSKNQGGIAIAQPIPILAGQHPQKGVSIDVCPTLPAAMGMGGGHTPLVPHPIAVDWRTTQVDVEKTGTLKTDLAKMSGPCIAVDAPTIIDRAAFNQGQNAVQQTMAIRRLTPKECERLQGFPDDWTKIPYRNKPADQCPDGPRYKACGNSMAVPVMHWIGKRIQLIDTIIN